MQFEQNEFVSRDPTDELDKEVKGVAAPLSRNSSSTALSALGVINSKAGAVLGRPGSKSNSGSATPSSSVGKSNASPLANGIFGARISAHNPVWKHEVSLCVDFCFLLSSLTRTIGAVSSDGRYFPSAS